jgi:glutaminyl-tRNA synthetase
VEMGLLDFCIRQELESAAPRGMAVLDPLKVSLTNYQGSGEVLEAAWHPQNAELGQRQLSFSAQLYIDREDFSESPPAKFKRLSPGEMVRLRYGFIIRCDDVVKDDNGEVIELKCSYFPDSRSGSDSSGLKPKGVIHWVDAATAQAARMRLYQPLFADPAPDLSNLEEALSPDSMTECHGLVEAAVARSEHQRFQFERLGYFCRDSEIADVYNRTVTLRDSYKPA